MMLDNSKFTDYLDLYDMYRIRKIKIEIKPQSGVGINSVSATARDYGEYVTYLDFNAMSSIGTGYENFTNLPYARTYQAGTPSKRVFAPRIQNFIHSAIGSSSAQGFALERRGTWIDSQFPEVPHFGYGYLFTATGSTTPDILYRMYATYYVEYKGLRDWASA